MRKKIEEDFQCQPLASTHIHMIIHMHAPNTERESGQETERRRVIVLDTGREFQVFPPRVQYHGWISEGEEISPTLLSGDLGGFQQTGLWIEEGLERGGWRVTKIQRLLLHKCSASWDRETALLTCLGPDLGYHYM